MKNTPTLDEKSYKLCYLEKIEIFIKKMRWRAIFFISSNKKAIEDYKLGFSYGLKNDRSPAQVKYFIQFKDDLVRIVKRINVSQSKKLICKKRCVKI